jgi:hypothetical protein
MNTAAREMVSPSPFNLGPSGTNAINPLVAFPYGFRSMGEGERCYSFILSRTPHETMTENYVLNVSNKRNLLSSNLRHTTSFLTPVKQIQCKIHIFLPKKSYEINEIYFFKITSYSFTS